ncbi:MAG: hypothetical protein K9N46_16910 [Candidatus Marinimicrobia bacterium]|nr:hypothetical protein [Candidatus Neomarinimicrobiota bacterium]MCF7830342.1 hypothetical protein [Candidatus Neomarinimicrobiota bacterium]MCF7882410.1 hypothetical protein [Candidatus Neomarinimicrobiota bacterium]
MKIEKVLMQAFSGILMVLVLGSMAIGQSEHASQPALSEVTLEVTGMT